MGKGRQLFSDKSSSLTVSQSINYLGKLVLLGVIAYVLISYVQSINDNTEFQKIFLSRDIALLAGAIHSSSGNLEYNYYFDNLELNKFNINIENKGTPLIKVSKDGIGKSYAFGGARNNLYSYSLVGTNSIKISKINDELKFKNE